MSAEKYHGRPCKNCGETLKFRSCRTCVACNRERSRRIQSRRYEDHITYYSKLLSNRRRAALKRREARLNG